MFRWLLRKWRFLRAVATHSSPPPVMKVPNASSLTVSLDENLALLKEVMGESSDVITRPFVLGPRGGTSAALLFIDGLVSKTNISEAIIRPLMTRLPEDDSQVLTMDLLESRVITLGEVKREQLIGVVVDAVLSGETALLVDGFGQSLILGTRGWEQRSVEEPQTDVVVRGPREGFVEGLRINTALLRRKIRNPGLTFDAVSLGRRTHTLVCVVYLKGVVNPRLVEEVKHRLRRIDTDAILESGYIEEYIEDAPFSPFATTGNSERPDTVAARILEGRVAILVDGTPIALTVPMLFVEGFQSPEDYYSRPFYSTLIRWVRYVSFAITVTAPAAYVALTTFHQELIPTPLLITTAAAREGTPFPAAIEVLGMMLVFEILREAGVRLPRPVGQAVSIVGALVIGESAVRAGLIGAPMVIVVAITAISSFVVPSQVDIASILRLILILLAMTLGAFGIGIGFLATLVHLASLRSFGVPYLSPFAPLSKEDLKDTLVRVPLWAMLTRPRGIGRFEHRRQEPGLEPRAPGRDRTTGDTRT